MPTIGKSEGSMKPPPPHTCGYHPFREFRCFWLEKQWLRRRRINGHGVKPLPRRWAMHPDGKHAEHENIVRAESASD